MDQHVIFTVTYYDVILLIGKMFCHGLLFLFLFFMKLTLDSVDEGLAGSPQKLISF